MDYIGNAVVEKCISLIQRKDEFPLRTENKIIELIEIFEIYNRKLGNGTLCDNYFRDIIAHVDTHPYFNNNNSLKLIKILREMRGYDFLTRYKINPLVEEFLTLIKDDIHDMMCVLIHDHADYLGLDSDRDTKEQVETAIRFFPEVLSRTFTRETTKYYPIQLLAQTVKAVSFVPLVARVALELGVFEDIDRGGLLAGDKSVCANIVYMSVSRTYDAYSYDVLNKMVSAEDIQRYAIWNKMTLRRFSNYAFQTLVNFNPSVLIKSNRSRLCIPLYYAAQKPTTIELFKIVFKTGIQYYPNKVGISLLFRMVNTDKTPFQIACVKFCRDEVMDVVESILLQFQQRRHVLNDGNSNKINNAGPYNVIDALLTAATDENIHLDCVYFLLRREPDVLQKLLAMKDDDDDDNNNNNNSDIGGGGENGNDGKDDEDHGSDSNHVGEKDDSSDDDDEDGSKNHVGGDGIRISNSNNNNNNNNNNSNTVDRLHRHQNNCMVSAADGNGKGKRKRNTNNNGTK
jgi:hypothetical protein